MATLSITTEQIVESLLSYNDNETELTTADVRMWCEVHDYKYQTIANRLSGYKSGRGKFDLSRAEAVKVLEQTFDLPTAECVPTVVTDGVKVEAVEYHTLVPVTDDKFVPFGNFKDVKAILKSKIFYPPFITGLSGNG